jgi:hypothetical protein
VDDFLLSGAKVEVRIGLLGDKVPALTLPDIHLTNLGSGADGITPGDLAKRVFGEISSSVFTQVTSVAGNLEGRPRCRQGLGDGAKGALDKAGSGIGNLFKKK